MENLLKIEWNIPVFSEKEQQTIFHQLGFDRLIARAYFNIFNISLFPKLGKDDTYSTLLLTENEKAQEKIEQLLEDCIKLFKYCYLTQGYSEKTIVNNIKKMDCTEYEKFLSIGYVMYMVTEFNCTINPDDKIRRKARTAEKKYFSGNREQIFSAMVYFLFPILMKNYRENNIETYTLLLNNINTLLGISEINRKDIEKNEKSQKKKWEKQNRMYKIWRTHRNSELQEIIKLFKETSVTKEKVPSEKYIRYEWLYNFKQAEKKKLNDLPFPINC